MQNKDTSTVHQRQGSFNSVIAALTADTDKHCTRTLIGCTVDLGGMPYRKRYERNTKTLTRHKTKTKKCMVTKERAMNNAYLCHLNCRYT
jgi:hypothetical protein